MSVKKPENPYRKSMYANSNPSSTNSDNNIEVNINNTSNANDSDFKELIDSLKKPKRNSKSYSFYLENDLFEEIEKLSKETNTSTSFILNTILKKFFNKK